MPNITHYPLIRTIYLYLFALLGLVLLIIGGVRFINMGLKIFIFTQADQERILSYKMPPQMPISSKQLADKAQNGEEEVCLPKDEAAAVRAWLADYKSWQASYKNINPLISQRQREASLNLALILVGLPLYLYHWRIIKRETKNKIAA